MARSTRIIINTRALLHNLERIKHYAPGKKVIAMLKANAYGCGIESVAPVLEGHVDAFGVSCLEEALAIRALGCKTHCIMFQGVFSADELLLVSEHQFGCVVHHSQQIEWLIATPVPKPIKIWIKLNTGMHRLGFATQELEKVVTQLKSCSGVDAEINLLSHLACADEPDRIENEQQMALFSAIDSSQFKVCSLANSAAIIAFPHMHGDAVRPGIMLYGVSPFASCNALGLGLIPVMRFVSAISAIRDYPPYAQVGYGGTWQSDKPSIIGIIPVGYGDGYPRHITSNTPVWVCGREVPIVGRVSMDMLAVDLTDHPEARVGDEVELWGIHIDVERVAKAAGTIGYELLCQVTNRARYG